MSSTPLKHPQVQIKKPLRVLMVTGHYPTERHPHANTFIKTQVDSLLEAGIEVEVVFPKSGPFLFRYMTMLIRIFLKMLTGKFDIIHGHYGQWCLLARLQWTTPVVASFLGSDLLGDVTRDGRLTKKGIIITRISRWLCSRVDAVTVKSQQMKKAAAKGTIFVYSDGIDFDLFHPIPRAEARAALGWDQECYYVLFGNDPRRSIKNFPLARSAIEHLRARGIPIELAVANGLTQATLVQYINASNAVILSSISEGSPNIVKEAMACNVPVVSTDVGDVFDLIGHTRGCRVCSHDANSLADALEEALQYIGPTTGRADIAHLEKSVVAKQILAVYGQVISKKKCGGKCMSIPREAQDDQLVEKEQFFELPPYPVDMSSFLSLSQVTRLDAGNVLYQINPSGYHPTGIAQYALALWNQYLSKRTEDYRLAFLAQAFWLNRHEVRIGEDCGGWPIVFPYPNILTKGSWLSASAQGCSLSVMIRAYQLTHEETFLETARRVVRTFERDILDGGVSTPVGEQGIFFEEVAVYPAMHTLVGFIFALLGLYDYLELTGDLQVEKLIQCSLATLHSLFDEFDLRFWTCSSLLHRQLTSPAQLALQVTLLEALARRSRCNHCASVAALWRSYQHKFTGRIRYYVTAHYSRYSQALLKMVRARLFQSPRVSPLLRVCVAVNAFPVLGGIRTVLAGIAQVTADIWSIEYLTRIIGPQPEGFIIHRFGPKKIGPWAFPFSWFYVLAGWRKLLAMMHQGADYNIFLPQDSIFTAAFMGLVARLAGVRVVCIDHGNLVTLKNRIYRAERRRRLAAQPWYVRLLVRILDVGLWPSTYILARIAAHCVDHYLVPGVVGDGVEEACQRLGVPASRITRFNSMIDIERHRVLDSASRASLREQHSIPADAIVIAIICRLALEKGLDTAVASISLALAELSPELRNRIRVIIAGDGPIRKQVEEDISKRGLGQTCLLWGDTPAKDVLSLLAMSDIFLNTSTRGTCLPMSILEAMASGCAVIASSEPLANVHLLTEGRGIAVRPENPTQTSEALVRLLKDVELCRHMGSLARSYIITHHSPIGFRRTLLRLTFWSGLDNMLDSPEVKKEAKDTSCEKEKAYDNHT